MSRAKQRAGLSSKSDKNTDHNPSSGIPRNLIKPKSNTQIPLSRRTTVKREAKHEEKTIEWTTRGLARKSVVFNEVMASGSHKKSIPLGAPSLSKVATTTRTSAMRPSFPINPRQPAGLAERLVKVHTDIQQPPNPHLLRVAVMGAANAGKSTLVNGIVGEDISVVSHKAHTTRERILGVLTDGDHQLVFLDTPGVVPDNRHARMNRTLVTSSWRSLDEADHVILLVDGSWALSTEKQKADELILARLRELTLPTTLVINKMDKLDEIANQERLEAIVARYKEACPCIDNIIYTSALHGDGLESVKNDLFVRAKPKPWLYPKEFKNDMPDLKRAEELIRVEFFKRLHQYIPYMLKQENMGWTELPDGSLRIDQHVYVERESQLKIVVGANGAVIDRVIADARVQIAKALKRPVHLYIQVKTKKK
ncbi:GTP-binding protein Era [Lichtheimia hyalospora FSU 10163]|nr:GTP-binding protein Era [Lichtheimia hyalospora FSU 10163]